MQDTSYLRSQAALCMRTAEQAANPDLADSFRNAAANYFAQAVRIEGHLLDRATTLGGPKPATR